MKLLSIALIAVWSTAYAAERKVAAETRSCALVAEDQARAGYPKTEKDFSNWYFRAKLFQETCYKDNRKLKGPQRPARLMKGQYFAPIDCDLDFDAPGYFAANVKFKEEFGENIKDLKNRITKKYLNRQGSLTKETQILATKEIAPYEKRMQQLGNIPLKTQWEIVEKHAQDICIPETEAEKIRRATLDGCDIPAIQPPMYVAQGPVPTLKPALTSVGFNTMKKLESILMGKQSCSAKTEATKALFKNLTVNSLDDLIIMSYVSKNFESILKNPPLRVILASVMKAELARDPFCNNEAQECSNQEAALFEVRNSLIGAELSSIERQGGDGYDSFDRLAPDLKKQVVQDGLVTLEVVLRDHKARHAQSWAFKEYCDGTISELMGDGEGVSTAAGYGLENPRAYLKNGVPCAGGSSPDCKITLLPAEYKLAGYDAFARMHFYVDKNLKDQLGRPLFAPRGWEDPQPGGKVKTQGSYTLRYKRFGRYRNVIYNPNHLGNPEILFRKNAQSVNPKNKVGSIQIGTIGGIGGGAVTDRATPNDSANVHSHLQVFSNDGVTLLNFVDAFCRGRPAP